MLSGLSVVFPAYNDEKTIPLLVEKTVSLLPTLAHTYEIIIVNDGSKDGTQAVCEKLTRKYPFVVLLNHPDNRGYGGALISGFKAATKEYTFYTDGDGQYNVDELPKLVNRFDSTIDMVTGYKLNREDKWYRKIIGQLYNKIIRLIFPISIRDIDCDFRLIRTHLLQNASLKTYSGAFDLEFLMELRKQQVRFKEIGVHHYAREYSKSQIFTFKRVMKSLIDIVKLRFSYGIL